MTSRSRNQVITIPIAHLLFHFLKIVIECARKRKGRTMEQSKRSCGSCSACCYTHNIEELDKWNFSPCAHMKDGGGCAIYGEHPKSCQTFACAWLHDESLKEECRPDILGLVINSKKVQITRDAPPTLLLLEAWPEAFKGTQAQSFAKHMMSQGTLLCVVSPSTEPRWQYHLYRLPETESYGEMLVERGYAVTWHEPAKMGHLSG
jgi:hypothetical protein